MNRTLRSFACIAPLALGLPSCLMLSRGDVSGGNTTEGSDSAAQRANGYAASITEHLVFDDDGWSHTFPVAEPDLAFEISEVKCTSDVVDLWMLEKDGRLRLLCPASLLKGDVPTLVVPPGAMLRVKRVIGKAADSDLLLSGRLVAR